MTYFIDELARWNDRMNLVGLKDKTRIVAELLFDTFFIFTHTASCTSMVDMGSGSGIVAVPLAILRKDCAVFSVDKSLRKIQFQRHIKRNLSLSNLTLYHGRVEEIGPLQADCLVAKAFGTIARILSLGGRHVRSGGKVIVAKGVSEQPATHDDFLLEEEIPYSLPGTEKTYRLLVYRKR